jgi:hypothetical protein
MSRRTGWSPVWVWLLWPLAPSTVVAEAPPAPAIGWETAFYNPQPAKDDLILPMDCGGAMAFRPVVIPGAGWLDDRRVELGQADENRGYKEGRRLDYLAGAFTPPDGDGVERVFYIAKYETTRDQYSVVSNDECPRPSMQGRLPATDVSWFDAVEYSRRYTEWLLQNARGQLPAEGLEPGFLRLPTEVEWEFATRGGLKVDKSDFLSPLFPMPEGGLAQYAWHESTQSAEGRLHPAGLLNPNPLGLYDLLGNAAEMTFVPFHLDHRGRPHGQAGGFVTRGGDIFTPPSQIGTAVRQEHSYFDAATGSAMRLDSVGFRLVLTAPVIVSPQRLAEIKHAWSALPSLVGDVGGEAERALKELQDVALRARDQKLRAKLELIQRDVEQAHSAINEARERTVRALLGTGAFMAKRVVTDSKRADAVRTLIDLAESKFKRLADAVDGAPDGEQIIADARATLESKLAKWQAILGEVEASLSNTLSYYGDMVIGIGRDYSEEEVLRQLKVVKGEFRLKRNEYLVPYADRFFEHMSAYRQGSDANKEEWLRQLLAIENEEQP